MERASGPRRLSALDATLLVMGGIVGVGIFFTPTTAAQRAFEPWAFLCLWLFGGAIALCAAFTFAELGGSFPHSGGWFVYLREAFGPFPAFLFAWIVLFVVSTGATAAMTTFCGEMLAVALPRAVGERGVVGVGAAAALVVIGVTAVALAGVKRAALLQNACMVIKVLVIMALVVCGFLLFESAVSEGAGELAPARPASEGSLLRGMLAALLPVFFTYGGWQMLGYVAPQVRRPERTLPRAIVLGVLGVVLLYLGANFAFLRGLGLEGIAADSGFASRIARAALGEAGERLLAGGMAVSALGVCAVTILATPWLYVAMAREGLFFRRFGALHARTGVPTLALLVQGAVALLYLAWGTLQELVDAVVFVEWIFHGLAALALLRLRRLRPELPRPFRSPLFPLPALVYAATAVLVVGSTLWTAEPRLKYTGLAIVAAGALAYRPWQRLVQ